MGSILSRLFGGTDSSSFTGDGSSSEPSRVIAFHSTDRWKAHFEASKESTQLMVIDFAATWCGPCRTMEPILNKFSGKFTDVDFVKIDVDELPEVAKEFKVEAMPTFLLIKQGKQVDKVVGAKKDELQNKIEKHRDVGGSVGVRPN